MKANKTHAPGGGVEFCELYTESRRRKHDLDEPKGFIGGKEPFGYHPKTE
jgi:hypothetical protein